MAIKALVFDWGDTIMRDLPFEGAMKDWPLVSLVSGAEEILKQLQKKYTIVMASNADDSSSQDIVEALKRVGVSQYFHRVFSSSDIGYEKPHHKFFQYIQQELKLEESELVMIGNSCEKDIEGAKSVSWKTIWFKENNKSKQECEQADATVYHMSALLEIIENI
ncbi:MULTISPECIES: HAD family hydrolase [unclassified Lentimicrobium]|uniref:HAD family hydrolase n=1 Tax=unclassified Lentimicrobium TaxID=2677434 RepID=UPI0015577597|nr:MULTISPECIES: HAD family hydrolase [unclassified Lentimicrobium]NPD46514.1 HAD family hydrolase [Lentimicrobium sp. S6]NPD85163.1 HAD family hydrolase [Lentimicrobium sp. L6]